MQGSRLMCCFWVFQLFMLGSRPLGYLRFSVIYAAQQIFGLFWVFQLILLGSRLLSYFECFSYSCWAPVFWVNLSVSIICGGQQTFEFFLVFWLFMLGRRLISCAWQQTFELFGVIECFSNLLRAADIWVHLRVSVIYAVQSISELFWVLQLFVLGIRLLSYFECLSYLCKAAVFWVILSASVICAWQ